MKFKINLITIISILVLGVSGCEEESFNNITTEDNKTDQLKSSSDNKKNSSNDNTVRKINEIAEELDADIKIDSGVNKDKAIVMESEEEFRNFIKEIKKQTEDEFRFVIGDPDVENPDLGIVDPDYEINSCSDGVYSGTALSTGFAELSFDVSVSGGCITGINGSFSGWTLGVSYSQGATQFGCNSGTVCGNVNYNVFLEGVGTVYSERMCFSVSLNC